MRTFLLLVAMLLCLSVVLISGCGPMMLPMTVRLREEDQKTFDGMWDNILTPVNRVDHQTLLDTVVVYMMFHLGVDRLHLVSEKYLTHGKVVMEIDCDRTSPLSDQFTITVVDDRGRTLRKERYSREDVEESSKALTSWPTTLPVWVEGHVAISIQSSTQPASEPTTQVATARPATSQPATTEAVETPEERARRLECERRVNAVQAATQPATVR
jgi:hypothetical protein